MKTRALIVMMLMAASVWAADEGETANHSLTLTFGDGSATAISYSVDSELPIQLETRTGRVRLVGPDNSNLGWVENRTVGRKMEVRIMARDNLIVQYQGQGIRPGRFLQKRGDERTFRLVPDDSPRPAPAAPVEQPANNAPIRSRVVDPALREDLTDSPQTPKANLPRLELPARDFDLIWDGDEVRLVAGQKVTRAVGLEDNAEVLLMQGGEPLARICKRPRNWKTSARVIVWSEANQPFSVHYGEADQPMSSVEIAPGRAKQFEKVKNNR